jgi:zinc protease
MKRFACTILAACLAGPALAGPLDDTVRSTTLKNGLLVLLAPDSTAAAADVAIFYRAGSRDERPVGSGLAYLFGRLMFGGSKGFPAGEHRRLLEREGATLNSMTNPDYTCFYQTLPPAAIDDALRLEADRMATLILDASRFESARRAAQEEREMRMGMSPIVGALQRLYAVAYEGHPYAQPVIGAPSKLEKLTLADAEKHYRSRFSPDRAVLTVVGRFDPAEVMKSVRKHFEPVARRTAPATPAPAFAPQKAERRGTLPAPVPQSLVMVGWRGPSATDTASPAMDVLAHAITGGVSSKLHVIDARRPDLTGIEGDYERSRDASLLFCVAAVAEGADTSAAEAALIDAVEELARQPLSDEDLDRARRQIEAQALFSAQSARGHADQLGAAQLVEGDYHAAGSRLDRVRQVTAAQVQEVAARALRPEARSVVWIHPAGGR